MSVVRRIRFTFLSGLATDVCLLGQSDYCSALITMTVLYIAYVVTV
jgi:hypothetical protein